MKPSTHRGTCQACGAAQRLPAGTLAKHGYTVKWGFFSGVCQGAGWRPYEQAHDLIERCIETAEGRKTYEQGFLAGLVDMPTEPKAWKKLYRTDTTPWRYEWALVDLVAVPVEIPGDNGRVMYLPEFANPHKKNLRERIHESIGADPAAGLLALAHKLNAVYAHEVKLRINQIDHYIAWQRRRIADWKPADLLPLEGR